MNRLEAAAVLRKVRAYRPAQTFDDLTADAWAEALATVRVADALEAVTAIGQRTADWIDPSLIRTEVKRIRAKRIADHGDPIPPAGLSVLDELAWRREAWRRIGDGETVDGRAGVPLLTADEHKAINA